MKSAFAAVLVGLGSPSRQFDFQQLANSQARKLTCSIHVLLRSARAPAARRGPLFSASDLGTADSRRGGRLEEILLAPGLIKTGNSQNHPGLRIQSFLEPPHSGGRGADPLSRTLGSSTPLAGGVLLPVPATIYVIFGESQIITS